MLAVAGRHEQVATVYEELLRTYQVDAVMLRRDLAGFIDRLAEAGLVRVEFVISWMRNPWARRRSRGPRAVAIGRVQAFLALSPDERALFLQAAWWLPLVALQLRLFGLRPFQRWSDRSPRHRVPTAEATEFIIRAQRARRFVDLASRYGVCRGNCLSRSVTLWHLLRQQGIATELRVGVTRTTGGIEAHAWIEFRASFSTTSRTSTGASSHSIGLSYPVETTR